MKYKWTMSTDSADGTTFSTTNIDTTDCFFLAYCITFLKRVITNLTSILEDSKTHKVKKDAGSQHRTVWSSFFTFSFHLHLLRAGYFSGKSVRLHAILNQVTFLLSPSWLPGVLHSEISVNASRLIQEIDYDCFPQCVTLSSNSANLIKYLITGDQMIFTHVQTSQNEAMYFQRRWVPSSYRNGCNSLSC